MLLPMKLPYDEFDLSAVRRYPLASRESKLLAARDFAAVVHALVAAHGRPAPIVWGLGAHVIKTGLSPVLIDLMARGFVSAIALNGAGVIHDVELALAGGTSEDVDATLGPGAFGMAEETGAGINAAIRDGVVRGHGLGRSVAEWLHAANPPHADVSLLCAAARLGVPVTVHVALGTDIVHMHPDASGAAIGEGSLRDFRVFTSAVARLGGGVYINCGSAVVLPEVFLKAVAIARNHGHDLTGLTTVNLDFLPHYRPLANVVRRPTAGIGHGFHLTGHHELLIPLLAAALVERTSPGGA